MKSRERTKYHYNLLKNVTDGLKFILWKKIQSMPGGCIDLWQEIRLKQLTAHAYNHLPLYRTLWGNAGLNIERIKKFTKSDLDFLPITKKLTFSHYNKADYVVQRLPAHFYSWKHTSGTSGEPFHFVYATPMIGNHKDYYINFLLYNFLMMRGHSFPEILDKTKIAQIKISRYNYPTRLYVSIRDFQERREHVLKQLQIFQGEVIESYPSVLVELAHSLERCTTADKINFRYAISYGETLENSQRDFIEKKLKSEIYDRYGLEEFGGVGIECEYHNGFHLNSNAFILEITDDNGGTLQAGKIGRVVITNLDNYVMPLIRYDTGDMGKMIQDPCSCGLETPRFLVKGRRGKSLQLEKKVYHHLEFDTIISKYADFIQQYQIKKIAKNKIDILLVPKRHFHATVSRRLRNEIRALIGVRCKIEIMLTSSLERFPSGKLQTILDTSEEV